MAIKTNNYKAKAKTDDFKYEVIEECGSLPARSNGDVVKIRYISWNGRDPKYDIRVWSTDDDGNERCGKGVGISGEELEGIYNIIGKLMEE
jgi:hypothetical protein